VAAIASATVLGQSLTSAFIVGAAMIVASALMIAND
jgi:drug/metabolite transporter (DMT)-like permease